MSLTKTNTRFMNRPRPFPPPRLIPTADGGPIEVEPFSADPTEEMAKTLLCWAGWAERHVRGGSPATWATPDAVAAMVERLGPHPGAARYAEAMEWFMALMTVIGDFQGIPEFDHAVEQAEADLLAAEAGFVETWGPTHGRLYDPSPDA